MTPDLSENRKKRRTFQKTCPGCDEIFLATRRDTIYCSNSCRTYVNRKENYLNKDQKAERDRLVIANNTINAYKKDRNKKHQIIYYLKQDLEKLKKENEILRKEFVERGQMFSDLYNKNEELKRKLEKYENKPDLED